jgi:hypothetical protein
MIQDGGNGQKINQGNERDKEFKDMVERIGSKRKTKTKLGVK